MDDDNSLAHYGVKGMKWGQRKARPSGGVRRVKRSKVKSTFKRMRAMSISAVKKTAAGVSKANDIVRGAAEKHRDRKLTRTTQKAKIQEQETRLAQQKLQEEINKRNLKIENRSALNKAARKVGSALGKTLAGAAKGMATGAAQLASESLKTAFAGNTWDKYSHVNPKKLNDKQLEKLGKRVDMQNRVDEALKKTKPKQNMFKKVDKLLKAGGSLDDLSDEDIVAYNNTMFYRTTIAGGTWVNPKKK